MIDVDFLEKLLLLLVYGAVKLDRTVHGHLVDNVISSITSTMTNDPRFQENVLNHSQLTEDDATCFAGLLCEESMKTPGRSFQQVNIAHYLDILTSNYSTLLFKCWPRCSLIEAICLMCQREVCTGKRKARPTRRHDPDDQTDFDGMTDRTLQMNISMIP